MKVAFNKNNGVFQLVDAPKPKKLFNKKLCFSFIHFKFDERTFQNIANIKKKLKKESRIMEIGCNDGNFYKILKIITI